MYCTMIPTFYVTTYDTANYMQTIIIRVCVLVVRYKCTSRKVQCIIFVKMYDVNVSQKIFAQYRSVVVGVGFI